MTQGTLNGMVALGLGPRRECALLDVAYPIQISKRCSHQVAGTPICARLTRTHVRSYRRAWWVFARGQRTRRNILTERCVNNRGTRHIVLLSGRPGPLTYSGLAR